MDASMQTHILRALLEESVPDLSLMMYSRGMNQLSEAEFGFVIALIDCFLCRYLYDYSTVSVSLARPLNGSYSMLVKRFPDTPEAEYTMLCESIYERYTLYARQVARRKDISGPELVPLAFCILTEEAVNATSRVTGIPARPLDRAAVLDFYHSRINALVKLLPGVTPAETAPKRRCGFFRR